MQLTRLALGAVLAVGLLSAQAKPNFSGTWTLVSSDAPEAASGVKRTVVVLTQTDSALTLRNENVAQTSVFPLDGSESIIKGPGRPDVTVRTRWEGAQLVVEQRTPTTAMITTVRLSDDGNELTVETEEAMRAYVEAAFGLWDANDQRRRFDEVFDPSIYSLLSSMAYGREFWQSTVDHSRFFFHGSSCYRGFSGWGSALHDVEPDAPLHGIPLDHRSEKQHTGIWDPHEEARVLTAKQP